MNTLRLSCSHALIKYLIAQKIIIDGKKMPLFAGAFGIYGHGNVACIGQAMEEFQDQLDAFVNIVMNNEKPSVTFEDGRNALILANAAYDSLNNGKSMKVVY